MRLLFSGLLIIMIFTGFLSCSDVKTTPTETATGIIIPSPVTSAETTPAITPSKTTPVSPETTVSGISETPPVSSTIPQTVDTEFKVVGYITHWHLNKLSTIDLKGITHLIWQGLEVTSSSDPALRVANNAGWWQITDVVAVGHSHNVKVLASLLGFWKESNINTIWKSADLRKQLVTNLVDMVKTYDLDGIDIDNENQGWDVSLYSTFIRELYEELSPLGKIISLAGSPYRVCITPDIYSYVDFVNLMTYDMGSPDHSTFDHAMQALDLWISHDMPKEKLLIGIPFYGRDADDSFYEYWWIIDKYKPAPDQNEVSEPKAYGGLIWWNGINLAREKVLYMKSNGFGGIMMYEIGQDTQGEGSLLQAVYDALEQPVVGAASDASGDIDNNP